MSFTYKPLWKTLIDKDMNKSRLREKTGISMGTLATMGKDEYIAMSVLDRICTELNCNIEDVIEHKKEE